MDIILYKLGRGRQSDEIALFSSPLSLSSFILVLALFVLLSFFFFLSPLSRLLLLHCCSYAVETIFQMKTKTVIWQKLSLTITSIRELHFIHRSRCFLQSNICNWQQTGVVQTITLGQVKPWLCVFLVNNTQIQKIWICFSFCINR